MGTNSLNLGVHDIVNGVYHLMVEVVRKRGMVKLMVFESFLKLSL